MLRDLWQMPSIINGWYLRLFLQGRISKFFFGDPRVWLLLKLSQDCYIRYKFNIVRIGFFWNLNAFNVGFNLVFAFFYFECLFICKTLNQSAFFSASLDLLSKCLFSCPLERLLLLFGKFWDIPVNSVDHSVPKLLIPVKNCLLAAIGRNIVQPHRINFVGPLEVTFAFLKEECPEEVWFWRLDPNLLYFKHLFKHNVWITTSICITDPDFIQIITLLNYFFLQERLHSFK